MLVSNGTGIAVSAGAGNKGVPLIVGMGTTDGSIGNGFGAKVSGKVVGTPAVEIAIPPVTGVGFTFCGFGFTTPGTIGVGVKLVVLGTTSFGATGTFGVIPPAPGITPIVGLGAICTGVRGTGSGLTASFGNIAGVTSVGPPCSIGFSSTPTAHSSLGSAGIPTNYKIIMRYIPKLCLIT